MAAHLEDADFVAGKKPFPKPKNILFRAVSSFIKPTPSRLTLSLRIGTELGNLRLFLFQVILQEALRYLMNKEKSFFRGTSRFEGSNVTGAPKQFTWDTAKEKKSIEKCPNWIST